MNYQTGDYIRFHTPEQWQQIVEKLEGDGQKIYTKIWESEFRNIVLDLENEWARNYSVNGSCKNDITDKFFEEILQDELCSNPPLEVGDEFTCTSKTYAEEDRLYTFKKLEGDYYFITWGTKNVVTDYFEQEIKDWFNITSYKQVNPVKEFSLSSELYDAWYKTAVEAMYQVDWKALQDKYLDLSIEQSKKFMENWMDRQIKITYDDGKIITNTTKSEDDLEEVENTFNSILVVNRESDYVETVSAFSDHSEATFYYWKDFEVVGDVTLNKIELQKMLSDMD